MEFESPLYVQRHKCVVISKASCIHLNVLISQTSKKKIWRTNFNPHKANTEIKKQFGLLCEMMTELKAGNYKEFVYLLMDSGFNKYKILGSRSYFGVVRQELEVIWQRLLIIYSILYVYIYGQN